MASLSQSETTAIDKWWLEGESAGWKMPTAPWWKRLPIIRHVRTVWLAWRVDQHYQAAFGIRTGYDEWVLWGMWRGMERKP